ncbi:calcium-binding protein [Kribbella sp. NBC_01505]|uniref:calcium-binding protein n=1 Tax=Kribbella sp. NBC_01505 TaxID=2903580 RepID=UPI00386B0881
MPRSRVSTSRKTSLIAGFLLVVPAALLPVADASAATFTQVVADPGLGIMTVTAAPGKANVIGVQRRGENLIVTDAGDFVRAVGCTPLDVHVVSCALRGLWDIRIDAGDLADSVTFDALDDFDAMRGVLSGGAGDDRLVLGPKSGSGTVLGGPGNDRLQGGPGDDQLAGNAGDDELSGGDGVDLADYSERQTAVRADIDDTADDGAPGEHDNIRPDVENLAGGSADDSLTGSASANRLVGGGGSDVLNGLAGNDVLSGDAGDDRLDGGLGSDELYGEDGADTLDAGTAKDPDLFEGGAGFDVVSYAARPDGVTVDNDGLFDDGATGERDNVRSDVEAIHGGEGNDQLSIAFAANGPVINSLQGRGGNDRLDTRDAGRGDLADGGDGVDVCTTDAGDNTRFCAP